MTTATAPARLDVAYFGNDTFAGCARLLLDSGHRIRHVFTHRTAGPHARTEALRGLGRRAGARVWLHPARAEDIRAVRDDVDVVISALYPHLIPLPGGRVRALNLHPTLLPDGRGGWPLVNTLLRGLPSSGVTVHEMEERFDTGPIVHQRPFPVLPDDSRETLADRAAEAAVRALADVLADWDGMWERRRPQRGGDTWPRPPRELQTLDWGLPVAELLRRVRAFGAVGTHAVVAGRPVLVGVATPCEGPPGPPGRTAGPRTAPRVAAVDGWLRLDDVVSERRRAALSRLRHAGWAVADRAGARLRPAR